MIGLVILVAVVFPLVPVLTLGFIPGRTHPGIEGTQGKWWRAAWRWLFLSLVATDFTALGLTFVIEKLETIGYGIALVAILLSIMFAIASFVMARYVGRQPWAWAICGLLSWLPSPGFVAFGVIGFAAIRRTLSGPISHSPLRVRIKYTAAVLLIVTSALSLGLGHLLYELVKNAKPLYLGVHASSERVLNTAREVFREAGFTIEESEFGGIVHAREPTVPTRYYEITTLGSRGGLEQLYVIRMDSKRSFWSLPMTGGDEMLPIPKETRHLFAQVKIRAEQVNRRRPEW